MYFDNMSWVCNLRIFQVDVEKYDVPDVVVDVKRPEEILAAHIGRRDYAGRELLNNEEQQFIESFIDREFKEYN